MENNYSRYYNAILRLMHNHVSKESVFAFGATCFAKVKQNLKCIAATTPFSLTFCYTMTAILIIVLA